MDNQQNNTGKFDFETLQFDEKKRIDAINEKLHKESKIICKKILHDGFVGTKEDFDNSHKIMIIVAEAHEDDPRPYNPNVTADESNDGFWVRNVVHGKENSKKSFFERLKCIYKNVLDHIYENDLSTVSADCNFDISDFSVLKNIAYINLKKVSGHNKVDDPRTKAEDGCKFHEWVDVHKENIAKQINEIAPNYIIVCGGPAQWSFKNILLANNLIKIKTKYFESYHPSYPCSTKKFIESFKFYKDIN